SESATCEKAAPTGTCTRTGSPLPSPLHAASSPEISTVSRLNPSRRDIRGSAEFVIRGFIDRGLRVLPCVAPQRIQVRLQDEHGGRGIDAVLALAFALRQAESAHGAFR